MKTIVAKELRLKGVPICDGIAIGKPFFFTLVEDQIPEFTIAAQDIEKEIERYSYAVMRSREDIRNLQKQLEREKIAEGAAVLDAYLQIMQDPMLIADVEDEIRKTRKNAECVFYEVIKHYQKKFQSLKDPFFRERFKDIQDISRRVMGYLRKSVRVSLADIPPNSVVFSQELNASDAAEANTSCVTAVVTSLGGPTSHAAIVARAKGIPYITNVSVEKMEKMNDVEQVILDGFSGEIIFNPTEETLQSYQALQRKNDSHLQELVAEETLPTRTFDGYEIGLYANIDLVDEVDQIHSHACPGVGLFRSEYILFHTKRFPSEEEQFSIYRRLVAKTKGLPIAIRTFDFGGDKMVLNHPFPIPVDSFFGCRAIRFMLQEKEIFKDQLRAILRAGAFGQVSILFPMITTLSELLEAKSIVSESMRELKARGEPYAKEIAVGCMIEVPSAVMIADLLARECDFLSVGTNDLLQYALAVDRRNHPISVFDSCTDPSMIRLLDLIVRSASRFSVPVTVCGEIAADPRFTSLLLGLGIMRLSVSCRSLPAVKHAVRLTTISQAKKLAKNILELSDAKIIRQKLLVDYAKKLAT